MAEATWSGGRQTAGIDWRMSASLENVPRGDGDVAEVTSLEGAVRAWQQLDATHRAAAVLKVERPIPIDDARVEIFHADGIAGLARRLPANG